ncbi:hypothetical protein BGZ81_004552, partial [Podila clonocystis]
MGGAMSTKLSGALTAGTVLLLAVSNMWQLAGDESVNAVQWGQHLVARVGTLLVLPVTIYLTLFHVHFSLLINQPNPGNSIQADYDLNVLSLSYRNSLTPPANSPKDDMTVWRDVAYGSVIQLTSEASPQMHLHSIPEVLPYVLSSGQQQIAGYAHSDLNTHWLVTRAETTPEDPFELPLRLQYLKNGDRIKLRHLTSRRVLHSHDVRPHCCPTDKLMCEVSAYNANDVNDQWVVEVVEPNGGGIVDESNKVPVIALESTIRLRHEYQHCHLYVRNNMLAPEEGWGYGRQEIICLKDTKATTHRTMWRITHNVHDFPLKNYHLRDASVYFAGWAISFVPFLFLTQPRANVLHHYFPALYFAILVACSVFSGITAFLPRGARLTLHISLIALVAGMFARLMPITYGTPMDENQCRSLDQWLAKTIKLGPTSSFLDCSFDLSNEKSASIPAPHVGKAVPVEKRPVLKAHYHHPDLELPYQDVYYLMPFQRPPQQWTKLQKAKPDVHQIQMLKGRLGQDFDWRTHTEDRLSFQRWIEQDGIDPWEDQRRAEEEKMKKKLEEEEEQRVLIANQRIERRRINEEKKHVEKERMEEEQRLAAEASIVAAQSQEVPNPNAERIENKFLEGVEEFRLALKNDDEELRAAREGQRESAEDKEMCERIQSLISTTVVEADLDQFSGKEDDQVVGQASDVEQEKAQESYVEEHLAEQISNEQEPVQETEPETLQDDTTPPSERAKRAYLETIIANTQHLADHEKLQDSTLPSDNGLPSQPDEAQKPTEEENIAAWLDKLTAHANNYAAKIHNEASGYTQFHAQEDALRAQGKKAVKQQLQEQQERDMTNKIQELKEQQRQQNTLRQGLKSQGSAQCKRPPIPKTFQMPGAPLEVGDFPLAGSGLGGIGLGALEEMDFKQLQELEEQLEPVLPLVVGMIDSWANGIIQSIKSGDLRMSQGETGAVSEKEVEEAPPVDIRSLLAQAQDLDQAQGQSQAKNPKTDPGTVKKQKVATPKKPKKAPVDAKKPPETDPSEQAPAEAMTRAQALDDARKESAKAMEQVQAMRRARDGKSEGNADLGFVPVDGKDDDEKLRLLQDAFKELMQGIQKKVEDELETR